MLWWTVGVPFKTEVFILSGAKMFWWFLMIHLEKNCFALTSLYPFFGDSPDPAVTGQSRDINVQLTCFKMRWILKSHLIFRAPMRWAKDFAANALQFKSFLCPASFPYTYWSQKHSPVKFLHTSLSFFFFF